MNDNNNHETQRKKRIITLTGKPPVRIVELDWPIVAVAKSWDNTYESQANRTWRIVARQHADGRAIVYYVCSSNYAQDPHGNRRGGEMLEAGADLARAIQRIGEAGEMDPDLIAEAIASLPPVDVDAGVEA